MPSKVTLASDTDVLVFSADNPWNGLPTFDRLIDWDEVPEVDVEATKRPDAIGDYLPQQTYPRGARPGIEGQWYSRTVKEARAARERLMGFYNDGRPITMIVEDELRTTRRVVQVARIKAPWEHRPFFDFTIDTMCEDARRYGPTVTATGGLAKPGSGLLLPSNEALGLGLDFGTMGLDFGTVGDDGRITITNDGNAETPIVMTVTGGTMLGGFDLVEVETGRRIPYVGDVLAGQIITIDTDRETAYIGDSTPAGRYLAAPQWFQLPRKASRTIAFVPRGVTSGAPTLTVATAAAYY